MIIMRICKNNVYSLVAMDQDADSVWVMTMNCLGHNNAYSQSCIFSLMCICEYALMRICIIVTQTLINKYKRDNNAYSE